MSNFSGLGRLKTGPDGSYTFMNTGVLEELLVPCPTRVDQDVFLAILAKANLIKRKIEGFDVEAKALFQSLLQEEMGH